MKKLTTNQRHKLENQKLDDNWRA